MHKHQDAWTVRHMLMHWVLQGTGKGMHRQTGAGMQGQVHTWMNGHGGTGTDGHKDTQTHGHGHTELQQLQAHSPVSKAVEHKARLALPTAPTPDQPGHSQGHILTLPSTHCPCLD